MKIYLPYIGEFGGELLTFVPRIHGLEEPADYVYCEEGKACLYPNVKILHELKINEGDNIKKTYKKIIGINKNTHQWIKPKQIGVARRFFEPKINPTKYDSGKIDVVIFPRKKTKVHGKNWNDWQAVVEKLKMNGVTIFAAGSREYSYDLNCHAAWDYDNCLEASIWAIQNSTIRIGIITALHVLSMMCKAKPIVLTNKKGMSALISNTRPEYNYLKIADHGNVGYESWPYLEDKEKVINEIYRRLSE